MPATIPTLPTLPTIPKGNAGRPYAQEVLADTPLLYWRLGESVGTTAADASGNGRTGTYSASGVTYGVSGAAAGDAAITTAGGAGPGHIQSDATLDLSAFSAITVEFWMNLAVFGTNDRLAMETSANSTVNNGAFYIDPNSSLGSSKFEMSCKGAGGVSRASFPQPTAAVFHHYVFTFTTNIATAATAWTVRVDKVAQTLTSETSNTVAALGNFTLNVASRNGASLFLNATLDEIAIYGSALSTARTDAHYDARNNS